MLWLCYRKLKIFLIQIIIWGAANKSYNNLKRTRPTTGLLIKRKPLFTEWFQRPTEESTPLYLICKSAIVDALCQIIFRGPFDQAILIIRLSLLDIFYPLIKATFICHPALPSAYLLRLSNHIIEQLPFIDHRVVQ